MSVRDAPTTTLVVPFDEGDVNRKSSPLMVSRAVAVAPAPVKVTVSVPAFVAVY